MLRHRRLSGCPLHDPPHLREVEGWFLISVATYEHKHIFSAEEDRNWLLEDILKELQAVDITCGAWVLLPNHYHLLVQCQPLRVISEPLRRVHARTARELNRRAGLTGRRVWYRFADRLIRSERHYYTTLNYIHYNPVKHGYAQRPLDWVCSSAHWYLEHHGIQWLRDGWQRHDVSSKSKKEYAAGSSWYFQG